MSQDTEPDPRSREEEEGACSMVLPWEPFLSKAGTGHPGLESMKGQCNMMGYNSSVREDILGGQNYKSELSSTGNTWYLHN